MLSCHCFSDPDCGLKEKNKSTSFVSGVKSAKTLTGAMHCCPEQAHESKGSLLGFTCRAQLCQCEDTKEIELTLAQMPFFPMC